MGLSVLQVQNVLQNANISKSVSQPGEPVEPVEPVTVGPAAPVEAAGSGRASSLSYSQLVLTNKEAFKGTKF